MVKGDSQDLLKKKVAEVREVVPNWSKHDIILVLTHFNQNVEETIQEILENQAVAILRQWHSTSTPNKPSGKKKKKTRTTKELPTVDTSSGNTDSGTTGFPLEHQALEQRPEKSRRRRPSPPPSGEEQTTPKEATAVHSQPSTIVNTEETSESFVFADPCHQPKPEVPSISQEVNTSPPSPLEKTDLSNSLTSEVSMASGGDQQKGSTKRTSKYVTSSKSAHRPQQLSVDVSQISRERTTSERSTGSASARKPHGGLERCYKDLQRQTASLQRHKFVIGEQMTKSVKELHKIFDQLKEELSTREVELMCELNKEKNDGENWLNKRYQTALDMKKRLDKVPSMKETDVINLRAEIKHFVSERRIDEDIASTKRFSCDFESLMSQIRSFGQVIPIKAAYTARHPSVSSVTSSIMSPDDILSPTTPQLTPSLNHLDEPDKNIINSSSTPSAADKANGVSPVAAAAGAKVISQSESLTRYEQLNPEDQRPSVVFVTRATRGRGQNYVSRGQGQRGWAARGQGPRGQGPRVQGSRSQGSRGQGPRAQGSRGQRPDSRSHSDASEPHINGQPTSSEKQDSARRSRNTRYRERQQQVSRDGTKHDKKDAAEMSADTRDHNKQGSGPSGEAQWRDGRHPRNSSPRKRSGKGQAQPNKPSNHPMSQEANSQQTVRSSGDGDQGHDVKGQGQTDTTTTDSVSNHNHKTSSNQNHNSTNNVVTEMNPEDKEIEGAEVPSLVNGNVQAECSTRPDPNKANSSGQRSVVVSVKEQTDPLPDGHHKSEDPLRVKDAAVIDSDIHSKSDFNANGMSKSGIMQNGILEQTAVKKATVSIEKLNEVSRATISVDGFATPNGALPQRKDGNRRRDRGHTADGQGEDRSTNGVCDVSS